MIQVVLCLYVALTNSTILVFYKSMRIGVVSFSVFVLSQTDLVNYFLVVVRSMIDCMETCPKMQEARVPYTDNMEQLRDVMEMVSDIVMVPGTQFRYPHTVGTMVWGTHTDVDEEGTWVNYYTKERVDQELIDNAIGGVSSSRMSNCAIVGSIFNGWIDWKCLLARNIFQKHRN